MKAVEVGQAMIAAKKVVMTAKEAEIFLMLFIAERVAEKQKITFTVEEFTTPDKLPHTFWVLKKRLEWAKVEVADSVLLLAGAVLSDRVGIAVLYAAAIKAIYDQNQCKVSFDDFVHVFSDGFPSLDEMFRIWRSQKVPTPLDGIRHGPDNWLDCCEAWDVDAPVASAYA
jgi:hypothetical protein